MAHRSRREARTAGRRTRRPVPEPSSADLPSAADAVLGGYRLLRRLASGERADVHLAVARQPPSAAPDAPDPEQVLVVVRVYDRSADDDAIATEIHAMAEDPTGAVPRLLDLAALSDGRACLVVERIGGGSLASMLEGANLSPGQVVTVLAPLVVAVRALGGRGLVHTRLAPSDVLVDETGRPRLIGLGALAWTDVRVPVSERVERGRRAHAALLALMETVVSASNAPARFGPPVELARAMLHGRPFAPDHEALERALFSVAEPRPLTVPERSTLAEAMPSRVPPARAVADPAAVDPMIRPPHRLEPASPPSPEEPSPPPDEAPRRSAARSLAELAQLPGVADGLGEALDRGVGAAARRRVRDWAGRRRAVLATGGLVGAAALVLLLTAVPPAAEGDGDPGAAESASVETTARPTAPSSIAPAGASIDAAATGGSDGGEAAGAGDPGGAGRERSDPVEAAAALLEIREGCLAGRDLACVASYAQPGAPIEALDLATMASGEPVASRSSDLSGLSVTADLGDAVVLSVPGAGEREPASLLMMRSEAGWRLREWFD
ncbi:protein kinase [Agromyces kandeliae]|uniref:Protein kinase n=1 Tax=Agromyces kandeliae TaxID=2666141 RepID=A0A6L5QXF8_9MICO|nr:protein kinase [Agromyces kandeliae]MRX42532.1 protein kinase [Agromyces kandeliae]